MTKRILLALFLLIPLAFSSYAQKPKAKSYAPKKTSAAKSKVSAPINEKDALEKALAETEPTLKTKALQQFIEKFPKSLEITRVQEVLVSTRAQLADAKLQAGDAAGSIKLFKQAVNEAPAPVSDKLFSEVIVNFPNNLFYRGEQAAAIEIARLIEEKVSGNAKQMLGLATFYLGMENAAEARRIAEKAITLDPQLPAAYQTLGFANRMDFQLDEAVNAYARALELDPDSAVSKRSLAEMKRAAGKPDEAAALYRELLEKTPDDVAAQTGLMLALFDADHQAEAETQLAGALEKNPANLPLLVGVAYWYAAHKQGDKAFDYAQKAVALEPRYTWGRIAMARALMIQGKPLEAEKELIAARLYGNFPTLDYEIASARLAAGMYEEAARELRKNFVIKDDLIETKLGNRVSKQSKDFVQLLELERRASIFEPLAADSQETAERLKSLLRFNQVLSVEDAKDEEIAQAVREFVGDISNKDDKAKIHRQLYAANRLLQARKNFQQVIELTREAIDGVDTALDVPNPSAAVMADELLESRLIAFSRNEILNVPEVPRQTLSAIVRGRIEEISGWALYHENNPQEAVVRLKRAVKILPEKSAWWRSSTWKLGAALDAAGKQQEALDIYIKNYQNSEPDVVKRSVIESLYQKVNGSLEGLDDKIGAKPVIANNAPPDTGEIAAQNTETSKAERSPAPSGDAAPKAETTSNDTATNQTALENTPAPKVETVPETTAKPENNPAPEALPPSETKTEDKPEESLTIKANTSPTVEPTNETKTSVESKNEVPPGNVTPVLENPEVKTAVSENKPAKFDANPETKPGSKPLFDPIIITVPKTEPLKIGKSASAAEKSSETEKLSEPNTGISSSESTSAIRDTTPVDNSGEVRSRVTTEKQLSTPESSQTEIASCRLKASQDSLSLLSQGGSLGVLLSFEGEGGDVSKITAASSSPDDIETTLEPDIGKQSKRAFYIIKSISSNKGAYTVTFDSPCGKKEVLVKVR